MVQAANVLIGGGTGFIGGYLVNLLKNGGAKVRVVTRNPKGNPDHVSWSSIRDKGLPDGTTAVVNLAGRNILDVVPWTKAYRDEVYSSRIETNRILVDAIHRAPKKPKSFIVTSGVGYYQSSETAEYNEDWIQPVFESKGNQKKDNNANKTDYLMDLARDWESSSELNEQQAPETRRVIIRSGIVLGKGGGVVLNYKLPFSLGLGGPLGSGKQWFPWIHVEDLANMFKFAIINDHVTGVINGVAPETVTNKDFALAFGRALNRPAILPMPEFAVRLMFGSERAPILLTGPRVKSRSEALGFRYQYSNIQRALEECVAA